MLDERRKSLAVCNLNPVNECHNNYTNVVVAAADRTAPQRPYNCVLHVFDVLASFSD